jgi:hypothetical protein
MSRPPERAAAISARVGSNFGCMPRDLIGWCRSLGFAAAGPYDRGNQDQGGGFHA